MEKIIVLISLLVFSAFSYGQNGGGGGNNGGPGMVLKYVDDNGVVQQFIVDQDGLNVPSHLMNEYIKQLSQQNINLDLIKTRENHLRRPDLSRKFVPLGETLDIRTNSGNVYDFQALKDARPKWAREVGGNIYVDRNAPILDYQKSDGEIVDFKELIEDPDWVLE